MNHFSEILVNYELCLNLWMVKFMFPYQFVKGDYQYFNLMKMQFIRFHNNWNNAAIWVLQCGVIKFLINESRQFL